MGSSVCMRLIRLLPETMGLIALSCRFHNKLVEDEACKIARKIQVFLAKKKSLIHTEISRHLISTAQINDYFKYGQYEFSSFVSKRENRVEMCWINKKIHCCTQLYITLFDSYSIRMNLFSFSILPKFMKIVEILLLKIISEYIEYISNERFHYISAHLTGHSWSAHPA